MKNISKHQFQKLVIKSTSKETSSVPKLWSQNNPTLGHCAIVALLVQEIYGGQILRASLEKTNFDYLKSHYWNILPNGKEYDFTKLQFNNQKINLNREVRERKKILKNSETMRRYKLFKKNLFSNQV